jgi:hypothetical protein
MIPSVIYEAISSSTELSDLGITPERIIESQSVDSRPFSDGYFITISFEEMEMSSYGALSRGPRICTIAVHHPWDDDRDFLPITSILNKIDSVLLPMGSTTGGDGLRVTAVRRQGRSGNLVDEGWKTITRTATYGVLFNEYTA